MCVRSPRRCLAPLSLGRLHIKVEDTDATDLSIHFLEIAEFIHRARMEGGCCYVHCVAGVSRSSTAVLAYLMAHLSLTYKQAAPLCQAPPSPTPTS